jgi:flagellar hook protein FlgE
MFESIYVGQSGLMGFSKGLNVISNNVANLNTPGFKSSTLQFLDLLYQSQTTGSGQSSAQIGYGLDTGSTSLNMKQGELRDTGNDLDVAIDGPGFFVLRKDGQTFYSRAGQFEFDANGYLVEKNSLARVGAMNGGSTLQDISINGLRASPPKATSKVTFTGNLSTGGTQHVISSLTVYDALGGAHALQLTFDNNNANQAGTWKITVADAAGNIANGQISFQNGAPLAGANSFTFAYTPSGASPISITLDFGKDVTATSSGTTSSLAMNTQDGYATGALTKTTFDANGFLTLTYSNNQTAKYDQMALAWFNNIQELKLEGGNLFTNRSEQEVTYGAPGTSLFGKIQAGRVELSNVDLTQQFSDLIITQRGYQASSQVISAANEMMQQLFDIKARR